MPKLIKKQNSLYSGSIIAPDPPILWLLFCFLQFILTFTFNCNLFQNSKHYPMNHAASWTNLFNTFKKGTTMTKFENEVWILIVSCREVEYNLCPKGGMAYLAPTLYAFFAFCKGVLCFSEADKPNFRN